MYTTKTLWTNQHGMPKICEVTYRNTGKRNKNQIGNHSLHIPMTALSTNSLRTPYKGQRLEDWINKPYPTISRQQETHFNMMI